jgi:Cdc6-like AAA superfamily ATPase
VAGRPPYDELRPVLEAQVDRRDFSEHRLLTRFGLISGLVGAMLARKRLDPPQIRALLLGKPAVASLGWDDFAHLGELRELAARIVAYRGVVVPDAANILIYGPPGTGKSEFVKTLAARLGFSAHFVGEHNGRTPSPTGASGSPR